MIMLLKILETLFVCALIPVYWRYYGPQNFLWVSDIALFGSAVALWTESSLLSSMEALSVFVFEIAWAIDILVKLVARGRFLGLSKYMFNSEIPLWVRLVSLFHLWLPWLLLWMVMRYGYDRRALVTQTIVWCFVIMASYLVSTPAENINFSFGIGRVQKVVPPKVYLVLMMVAVPLAVYLPTHFFLQWIAR